MNRVAGEMDALRISLAETEVLSTLTTAAYDAADWGDADRSSSIGSPPCSV